MRLQRLGLVLGGVLSLAGVISAPVALAVGIAIGVGPGNPWPRETARFGKWLLQAAVVGLGFGVSLATVWEVGRSGLFVTLAGIGATLAAGAALGAALRVSRGTTTLVSFGTAICGGSAIAAMAPAIGADDDEIAVSLATVFSLNAVALFAFPPLGRALGLTQEQFGYWAALAIHDTSSVVAAGSVYGAVALGVATTVKLARAAWIAPFALAASYLGRGGGRVVFPWFIVGFIAAAALSSALPSHAGAWEALAAGARRLLVLTLLLIGAGVSRAVLRKVGSRPLVLGFALWALVSAGSLLAVTAGLLTP